jgi:hypothetical protein
VNRTITIAPVRKSIVVAASPDLAFEVFTKGIDRWWPKTHGIGKTPLRESIFEPFVGGRWYTRHEDGEEAVIGHVRIWKPAEQVVVSWEISADWKPDSRIALASEVDVRFTALDGGSTRVDLEHRNFERMPDPGGERMRREVDGGWPAILDLYAKAVADRT